LLFDKQLIIRAGLFVAMNAAVVGIDTSMAATSRLRDGDRQVSPWCPARIST
jgi:hypothetical protein